MSTEFIDFSLSYHPCRIIPLVDFQAGLFENPPKYSDEFRDLVAQFHGVEQTMVLPLNGASEGIALLPHRFKKPAGIFPLFSDYTESFFREQVGIARFTTIPDERIDADLFIVVNPQNPTGTYYEPSAIIRFARKNPQITILVDETFLELGDRCDSMISWDLQPNIIVLRSLTESSGWPSLRAGFFVGSPRLITELKRWVLPWQITSISNSLIQWYYSHQQEFRDSWEIQRHLRRDLLGRLLVLGCQIGESRAPFLLFKLPKDIDLKQALTQYGIVVRDCRSYNLLGWYRVTPRSETENNRLAVAIGAVLHN